jgi:hypothetical protein
MRRTGTRGRWHPPPKKHGLLPGVKFATRSEISPQGWTLSPRENVHPLACSTPWVNTLYILLSPSKMEPFISYLVRTTVGVVKKNMLSLRQNNVTMIWRLLQKTNIIDIREKRASHAIMYVLSISTRKKWRAIYMNNENSVARCRSTSLTK